MIQNNHFNFIIFVDNFDIQMFLLMIFVIRIILKKKLIHFVDIFNMYMVRQIQQISISPR